MGGTGVWSAGVHGTIPYSLNFSASTAITGVSSPSCKSITVATGEHGRTVSRRADYGLARVVERQDARTSAAPWTVINITATTFDLRGISRAADGGRADPRATAYMTLVVAPGRPPITRP